jgi:hypothetical protein
VTGGSVQKRVANAKLDPTFSWLMLRSSQRMNFNINRVKLENLLHRILKAPDHVEIRDRFGHPATPREWFCPIVCD